MERTAHAWVELMRRLGYTHYAAQGGDWGAGITTRMAQIAPEGLAGIHLNWPFVIPAHIPTEGLSADEQAAVASANKFLGEGSGYFRQQATWPQTIGYGLADSAVGQLAWVYEKFRDWTDSHGDPENVLTKDEILDDVMLYWLPDAAGSSARFYWENRREVTLNLGPVEKVPVACSIFPREIYRAPRRWAEQTYKRLIYWNELERGGHFAALEQPEIFVNELRAAFDNPLFRERLA